MINIFLLPLFAIAFMVCGGRGGGGGGRAGRNQQLPQGRQWDRDGDHANYILHAYLAGNPNFADWRAFKVALTSWLLTAANLTGYYLNDNLRRNFNSTIDCWEHFQNPDDDFDGEHTSVLANFFLTFCVLNSFFIVANYLPDFLERANAPGIPQKNPDGINFAPGSDHKEEGDDIGDLPAQFNNPPSVINLDTAGVSHRSVARMHQPPNQGLEDQLNDIIGQRETRDIR